MDIYITEKESGVRYALSMLPERITCQGGANLQNYDIIRTGEVKRPNGTKLLQFSWSGIFPGESRLEDSFVKAHYWHTPAEMQNLFDRWRTNGTVLTLMVTETWINHDVIISEFSAAPWGGNGDVDYEVTFLQNREIRIQTVAELNLSPEIKSESVTARPPPPAVRTYTVKSGDCLWNIAKKYLGKGSRYPEIYGLNKSVIGSDPNKIYPGQIFTLPV